MPAAPYWSCADQNKTTDAPQIAEWNCQYVGPGFSCVTCAVDMRSSAMQQHMFGAAYAKSYGDVSCAGIRWTGTCVGNPNPGCTNLTQIGTCVHTLNWNDLQAEQP